MSSTQSSHKYGFGLIGNCNYSALVDLSGNVNWMCWPRYDSSSVFGSLLDSELGYFYIRPGRDEYTSRQYYLPNTAILCTEFESADGVFRVSDFAPRFKQYGRNYKPLILHRKIELLQGAPLIKVGCQPRFAYGKKRPNVYRASNHLKYEGGQAQVRLYSSVPLSYIEEEQGFVLQEDESLILTLGTQIHQDIQQTSQTDFGETFNYWRNWSASLSTGQFHQEEVIRSAITLKLHQYDDTGAIIAATTTSLPEYPGSERTWDYRYSWIRDSYYTLSAFNSVGKFDELKRFSKYLQNILIQAKDRIQPLYSITGEARLEERLLDLSGYKGNQPVRIGNQAYTHIQNDVYGQILLSLLPLYVDARFPHLEGGKPYLGTIKKTLDLIKLYLEEPDAGLWEFRTKVQHHCYTYLFHWAGAKAAKKIAIQFGEKEMELMAQEIINHSEAWIEKCYNNEQGVYSQAVGSTSLDASLFQLVTMSYLDPKSDRAKQHIKGLVENLGSHKNLFYRYRHKDDFGSTHASFLVCAFWYVEALAAMGEVDQAMDSFEDLLGYANHLGLFSEDVDAKDASQWGNFPQTYSHVGLINSAARITRQLDRPSFF